MASPRSIYGALAATLLLSITLGGSASAKSPPKSATKSPTKSRTAALHGKSKHWSHRNDRAGAAKTVHNAINTDVTLTPFPSQAAATRHALAQNRRDHLEDAERAARAAALDDRWSTVLFSVRDLDSRADPEGCFWRLVAYYRMGQIERARQVRQNCELPSRDQAILEAEDAEAAAIQPPLAMAERDHPPAPVANPAPYGGAAPTRSDR
ncbi:MAG TPA: hypothetical protein VN962_17330 [Polyangia bacterium]|nr:hypothetical protein [Polyangia bacterium]